MSCSHAGAVKTRRPRPIITSLEPGETWSWCFVDEEVLEIP